MRATSKTHAWAIRTVDLWGKAFLWGRYWWLDGMPKPVPGRFSGYCSMAWDTREKARSALRTWKAAHMSRDWYRKNYGRTTVVRVEVTLREVH